MLHANFLSYRRNFTLVSPSKMAIVHGEKKYGELTFSHLYLQTIHIFMNSLKSFKKGEILDLMKKKILTNI